MYFALFSHCCCSVFVLFCYWKPANPLKRGSVVEFLSPQEMPRRCLIYASLTFLISSFYPFYQMIFLGENLSFELFDTRVPPLSVIRLIDFPTILFFYIISFSVNSTLILHNSNIQCLLLLSIGFCEYGYSARPLILLLFLDPHSILTRSDLHIYLLDQICFRIIFKSPSTSKLWRKICNLIWDSKEGINSLKMKLNTLERSRFISCLWFDLFHWRQINFWALTWCCRITAQKDILNFCTMYCINFVLCTKVLQ